MNCPHLHLQRLAPHGSEDDKRFRVRCSSCKETFEARPFVIQVWKEVEWQTECKPLKVFLVDPKQLSNIEHS